MRREVLYSILIEFGILMKLVGLIDVLVRLINVFKWNIQ
jgi:hypothetical protein